MAELTSNTDGAASLSGFERYLDRAEVAAVLDAK